MKRLWPMSLPEYKWPQNLLTPKMIVLRGLLAGVFHLAYAIGLLISLFQRGRDRVLVIRTDGLGDALLFEPALESLARILSPREIHLWAPKLTCELLAHCPTIRRLMVIPRGFKNGNLTYFRSVVWRARIGFELGRCKFDKVIYPVESPEPLGNWLFASARATERWLNYGDTNNQFDWQQARTHEAATRVIETRPGNAHELQRNEYLAEQWGGEKSLRTPKVYLTEQMLARAETQVDAWRTAARKAGGAEVVGVVPSASMPVKSYPDAKWTAALKRLWTQHRVVPVLLGGPDDWQAIDRLAAELIHDEVPYLSLAKPLGILDMTALVGKLDAIISVDTGLAHLAVAQQTPSIVLVTGGTPGRFFPWPATNHHAVLNVSMPCSGCNDRCTLEEAACITHINPDEIVSAYARLKGRRISLDVYVNTPAAIKPGPLQAAG
jgi:ADP-heptose:LPS heptosyltransferase